MKHRWFSFLLALIILLPFGEVWAQSETPPGPVYIVQEGDYLSSIAERFDVSVEDLIAYNRLANPDLLKAGDQLVIPGLEGIEGQLQTKSVSLGDTLRSLSRPTIATGGPLQRAFFRSGPALPAASAPGRGRC